jgi:amino acid adenylation domain-containing protein
MNISDLSDEKRELLRSLLEEEGIEPARTQRITRRERLNELPLSFAQQRIWFFEQLNPGSPFYNTFQPILITGPLNIAALRQSFDEIVRRHEALRTTFATKSGQPSQVIAPTLRLPLKVVDLKHLAERARGELTQRLAIKEAQRPFDLAHGPLWRITLLRLEGQQQLLLLSMHHIVSDGWSLGILCREIAALYEAFSSGIPSPLPELPVQYADFAIWQRELLQGQKLEEHLAYWVKQLDDAPPLLDLPSDRPRPSVHSFRGKTYTFTVPRALSDSLRDFSRREEVTLFMTLLAAFNVLLSRYTGQKDIVVGSAIANRNQKEIENLIGFFVNTLALRTDLSGDPGFRQLLRRVRDVTIGAYNHQNLPFEKLVEMIQPERNLGYSPIYQVEFTLQNSPVGVLTAHGLTLQGLNVEKWTVETDFNFIVTETAEGLVGAIEYSTDLFDETTIARMSLHFQILLEGLLRDADQPISRLPLLTESEFQQLVNQCNDTITPYPQDTYIHQLFEAQAARTPDATAIAFEDSQITYADLNRRANQLAHYLQKLGVGPESLVGIYMERSVEMLISILGILKAGGAYVPLDPGYPQQRLAAMLANAGVSLLLIQERFAPELQERPVRLIRLDADWKEIAQESAANPTSAASAENLAYVIFTSGSTGQPKGVLITHRALVNYTIGFIKRLELSADDRVLQFASISFDVAVEELFPTWLSGATVVMRAEQLPPSPSELLRLIEKERVTLIELPTAYWHEWVNELTRTKTTAPTSVRAVIIGGERVSPKHLEAWEKFGVQLINVYGLTEATVTSTVYEHLHASERRWTELPIGSPLANTQVYLLDEALQAVPLGVPGELFIGGESLARAYLNAPDLTAERFIPSPFGKSAGARLYRTGDQARYAADGNLFFLGRLDQQVKIRGYRIEPGEVETLLRQNPALQEVIVLAEDEVVEAPQLIKKRADGSIEVEDSEIVAERLQALASDQAEQILADIEGLSESEVEAILASELQVGGLREQVKTRRLPEFDIVLKLKDDKFISPPHEAQRNWVIRRALDEFADDLKDLDQVTKQFVPGAARLRLETQLDWDQRQARYDETQLLIGGQQVMQDWERPLMRAMAEVVTETHGDILELGFGMAISATYIQEFGARSYTVVEYNDGVAEYFNKWKSQYPGRDIRLIKGKWHNVIDQLGTYDGVFFDTVPTDEEEYTREVINNAVMAEDFFPVAARVLRKGGIFTWYTNEINSLSRRHQRLILKYFSSFTVTVVRNLLPPEDCHYWFADSMVVVKAIK